MLNQNSPFPIAFAIRQLLDAVTYSNPLTDWAEPQTIDYLGRERRIGERLKNYAAGGEPIKAYEIAVPKKSGEMVIWSVPSIEDQIILQTCVQAIAPLLESRCLAENVNFSHRLNRVPASLAFLENQVDAWKRFQLRIQDQCTSDTCILQIDLKWAFSSIRLESFARFIAVASDNHPAAAILVHLIKHYAGARDGVPFINDSVFFLGNAYLSLIDKAFRAHGLNFVRFSDDYRIFGHTKAALEAVLPSLRKELDKLGFTINESKLKLGTAEEYLDAVAAVKYSEKTVEAYQSDSWQSDPYPAEVMLSHVIDCLKSPLEFLHQGYGRLLQGSLRRLRKCTDFRRQQHAAIEPLPSDFESLLSGSVEATSLIVKRLEEWSVSNEQCWRLLWLLNLCQYLEDELISDKTILMRLREGLERVACAQNLDPACRLWVMRTTPQGNTSDIAKRIEQMAGLDYLAAGRMWHGQ